MHVLTNALEMVEYQDGGNVTSDATEVEPVVNYSIPFWIFLFTQTFITITANSMLCWLFIKHRSLRSTQNYFVFSLSVADLLVGLTVPPCEYCTVNTTSTCELMCGSAVSFNMCASTVNLVLIATDRYCSINYPFRYHEWMRQRYVYMAIGSGWLFTFLLIATPLTWILSDNISAGKQEQIGLIYSSIMFSAVFLVGLLLGVCYYVIVTAAHEKLRVNKEQPSNPAGIKVCVIVAISFFLCWIPQCVVEIALQLKVNVPRMVSNCAYFVMLTNPCLDPVLYAYYRRDFRRELRKWLQRRSNSLARLQNCLRDVSGLNITNNNGEMHHVACKDPCRNVHQEATLHATSIADTQIEHINSHKIATL